MRDAVDVPVLCKDFMVDVWQVTEARVYGADAILVILALVEDDLAADLMQAAEDQHMDALVEVHDEDELQRALQLGAPLIGVNARDLRTLEIDREQQALPAEAAADRVPARRRVGHRVGRARRGRARCRRRCAARRDRADARPRAAAHADPRGRMSALQIKLCGFTRPEDAAVAVAEGADLIGVILWAPSPRAVDPDGARRVREVVPDAVPLVGVFVDEEPETIDELVAGIGLDRVQLHGCGAAPRRSCATAPRVPRRARRRCERRAGGRARRVRRAVLAARPRAPSSRRTGQRRARLGGERAVLLAGGLDPDNVADAVRAARPYGVDCARGIELSPGIKDHDRLRRFVAAAREAEHDEHHREAGRAGHPSRPTRAVASAASAGASCPRP